MASRFQAAALVASPSYPSAIAWSEENLIAVASGHLVTILNPAKLLGPRGIVTIRNIKPFPIGVVDRKDLLSGCLLSTCLSRDQRACVRSISWSCIGMAPNSGCLLAVCTKEGRVKIYRPPFCDYSAEWVEVVDISEKLYEYLSSINFGELDITSELCNEQPMEHQCYNDPPKSFSRRICKRKALDVASAINKDSGTATNQLSDPGDDGDANASSLSNTYLEEQASETNHDEVEERNELQVVTICKSKAKPMKKASKNCVEPLVTANQFAYRSAMLSSLAIAWSQMLHSSSKICEVPPDGLVDSFSLLAVGGKSGKLSLWRIFAPQCYYIKQTGVPPAVSLAGLFQAHNSWITAINWVPFPSKFSESMVSLISGSSDGSVRIWQVHCNELLKSSENLHTSFSLLKEIVTVNAVPVSTISLNTLTHSCNKMLIAIGKGSGSIEVWISDISKSEFHMAGSYDAHDSIVTGSAWAFDGCCLYSCAQDNFVRNWILQGKSLCEVPIPPNIPGLSSSGDLPNVFDSCFGIAVSPGSLVVAVVRSFDIDLLNPMYQARSQKAAVEFFWIGGQQLDIPSDPYLKSHDQTTHGFSKELIYWESNILWSLKQYEDPNKPLVLWDIIAALLAFKQTKPKFVEQILVKWLSTSYIGTNSCLHEKKVLTDVSKCFQRMSSRQLHLLNIICRHVILQDLNDDQINSEVQNLTEVRGLEEEKLTLWVDILSSSERELRERLVGLSFSAFESIMSNSNQSSSQPGYWQPAGLGQMEQWVQLNINHVHNQLRVLLSRFRALEGRSKSSVYMSEEQCTYCSSSVPFESPEVASCQGLERNDDSNQSHKLTRCAVSMRVCSPAPTWFCMCCRRHVSELAPDPLFKISEFPLDFKSSTENPTLGVPSKPLCPFCGIQLQRPQPEFLLSLSPL